MLKWYVIYAILLFILHCNKTKVYWVEPIHNEIHNLYYTTTGCREYMGENCFLNSNDKGQLLLLGFLVWMSDFQLSFCVILHKGFSFFFSVCFFFALFFQSQQSALVIRDHTKTPKQWPNTNTFCIRDPTIFNTCRSKTNTSKHS